MNQPAPFADLVTREQFIAEAVQFGITLEPHDITGREPGDLYIDGMPAAQWLDAMTMR